MFAPVVPTLCFHRTLMFGILDQSVPPWKSNNGGLFPVCSSVIVIIVIIIVIIINNLLRCADSNSSDNGGDSSMTCFPPVKLFLV